MNFLRVSQELLVLLFLAPLLAFLILFGAGMISSVVRLSTMRCDGFVIASGGSAWCLPKSDLSKPSHVVERLADIETLRALGSLLATNPSVVQKHNGLWDPCPPEKLPICKED